MKPTEEQIKEFWVRCGFCQSELLEARDWCTPEGEICSHIGLKFPLPIDLNNLFKYAVPKILGLYDITIQNCLEGWGVLIHRYYGNEWEARDKDPALALFWALREALCQKA